MSGARCSTWLRFQVATNRFDVWTPGLPARRTTQRRPTKEARAMPLPKPNDGETKEEFLDRCMADETMQEEFPDEAQRYAVCLVQWDERSAVRPQREIRMAELRAIEPAGDANEMIVEGRAIVYESPTVMYEIEGNKYYEVIARGALEGADLRDVPFKYNHSDSVMVMARTR